MSSIKKKPIPKCLRRAGFPVILLARTQWFRNFLCRCIQLKRAENQFERYVSWINYSEGKYVVGDRTSYEPLFKACLTWNEKRFWFLHHLP